MENQQNIRTFIDAVENKIATIVPTCEPKEVYEPFKYLMSGGGKRLRPVLALLACGAVSGECMTSLDVAVAIEIIHNFTLAHDDVMDNSPLRRGRETIHTKWNVPAAILTGDLMIGYAYRLLNAYKEHKNYQLLVDTLSKSIIEVCEGQAYDIKSDTNPDVTLAEYFKTIGLKTSVLIQSSVRLGALVGDATEQQLSELDKFAYNYGLAFQIQDDLLDITADQTKFGKPIGQDILEGKKTYLVLKAKELATDDADKALINKYLHSNGLPASYIQQMKNLFEKLNIFALAQEEIDILTIKAKLSLETFGNNDYSKMLLDLISSLNFRVK